MSNLKSISKKVLAGLPDYALEEIYKNAKGEYGRKTVENAADVTDQRIKNWERT